MSKKRSPEDVIIAYFADSDLERANLILGIVKGIVKRRTPPTPRIVAKRKRAERMPITDPHESVQA